MTAIGIIGTGNMGYAILKGLMNAHPDQKVIITDVNLDRSQAIAAEFKIQTATDNLSCVKGAKYILLAVKPQYFERVLSEIKEGLTPEHILISIAPGITSATIQQQTATGVRIVRAMPNTPALVGEGMTGVCYDTVQFSDEEKVVIRNLFESFGKMQIVEEKMMNAVVCVSGSAPAYMYMFIEALADSAVKYGLSRDVAYQMATQTMLGSAKMVQETREHPGKLKDMVCSPGGTTIAAVAALEEFGFRNAIMKASDACFARAEELK